MKHFKKKNKGDYYELTEKDFYPPSDDRVFVSGVEDIKGGDNYYDYAEWFYNEFEQDLFN